MPPTAAELYARDPDFRALIARWVRARRCPLVTVDYLLDREMHTQAECARWTATEPKRKVFMPLNGERKSPCGPFPSFAIGWYWVVTAKPNRANEIMHSAAKCHIDMKSHDSPEEAILALLDAWLLTAPVETPA